MFLLFGTLGTFFRIVVGAYDIEKINYPHIFYYFIYHYTIRLRYNIRLLCFLPISYQLTFYIVSLSLNVVRDQNHILLASKPKNVFRSGIVKNPGVAVGLAPMRSRPGVARNA